jgi:hypothetical protein
MESPVDKLVERVRLESERLAGELVREVAGKYLTEDECGEVCADLQIWAANRAGYLPLHDGDGTLRRSFSQLVRQIVLWRIGLADLRSRRVLEEGADDQDLADLEAALLVVSDDRRGFQKLVESHYQGLSEHVRKCCWRIPGDQSGDYAHWFWLQIKRIVEAYDPKRRPLAGFLRYRAKTMQGEYLIAEAHRLDPGIPENQPDRKDECAVTNIGTLVWVDEALRFLFSLRMPPHQVCAYALVRVLSWSNQDLHKRAWVWRLGVHAGDIWLGVVKLLSRARLPLSGGELALSSYLDPLKERLLEPLDLAITHPRARAKYSPLLTVTALAQTPAGAFRFQDFGRCHSDAREPLDRWIEAVLVRMVNALLVPLPQRPESTEADS